MKSSDGLPGQDQASGGATPKSAATEGSVAETWTVWPSLYEGMAAAVVHDVEPLRTICEVRRYSDSHVLAASLDMLRTLQRVDRWINTSVPIGTEAATSILGVIRGAIAKAEGRS